MVGDERDFWADEPTRSLPRLGRDRRPSAARGRRHGDPTRPVPVVRVDDPTPVAPSRAWDDPAVDEAAMDAAWDDWATPSRSTVSGSTVFASTYRSEPYDVDLEDVFGADAGTGFGADDPVEVPIASSMRRRRAAVAPPAGPARRGSASTDPLLRRLGVMVAAVVAVIPVAATLRDSGAEGVVRDAVPTAGDLPSGASSSSDAVTVLEISTALPSTDGSVASTAGSSAAPSSQASTTEEPSTSAQAPTSGAPSTADEAETTAETTAETRATVLAAAPAPTEAAEAPQQTPAPPTTQQPVETAAPVTTPPCAGEYEVVQGDYWILIADKIDVSTSELFAVNGAGPDTPLYAGRTICVPAGASPTTTTEPPPSTTAPKPTATTAPPTTAPATTQAPAPTTAPPTTQAPAPTTPPRSYTQAEVEQIVRDVWPDDLEEEALRIVRRESNFQPTAKNFCCYGLFQIYWEVHRGWLDDIGVTSATQLFDPRVNANAALTLYYRAGGWGPWALG